MRSYTKEGLAKILEQHIAWIRTDGKEGSRADLSGADLSGAYLSGAYLSRADLSGAYLSGAYLSRADLSGADLSGADLSIADLRGVYLIEADLSGANLRRADLSGAYLNDIIGKRILTFQGNKHFAYYCDNILKIGCITHTVEEWLGVDVELVKDKHSYTDQDISDYKAFIRYCHDNP